MSYKALHNQIIEVETGKQIAVVLPSNCSKKAAAEMATYCAQQMNHRARDKMQRKQSPGAAD